MLLLLAVYIEVDLEDEPHKGGVRWQLKKSPAPKLEFKTASFSSSEVLLLLLVSEHSAQWIEL